VRIRQVLAERNTNFPFQLWEKSWNFVPLAFSLSAQLQIAASPVQTGNVCTRYDRRPVMVMPGIKSSPDFPLGRAGSSRGTDIDPILFYPASIDG